MAARNCIVPLTALLLVPLAVATAAEPVDKDLMPEARKVLSYLESVYGQKTIAALSSLKHVEGIKQASGKEPAIVGFDLSAFNTMKQVAPGKMITLAECEAIPNPNKLAKDGPPWLYCLPWWGIGNKHTAEWAKATYAHEHLITLDRLPKWKQAK